MRTQINRNGGKHKQASGVRESQSYLNYMSVYHACNDSLRRHGLDTTPEYIHIEKEEKENDNSNEY